jgi:hypothetical protein
VHYIRTSRHASSIITAALLVVIGIVVGITRHDPGDHRGVELRADQQSLQPSPTVTVPSDLLDHTPAAGSEHGATPLTIGKLGAPIHAPATHHAGRTTTGSGGNGTSNGRGATNTTIGGTGSGGPATTTGGRGASGSAFVPGRIAFSAAGALWTMNPDRDAPDARKIASGGYFPAWSPDHKAIAFADADGAGGALHVVSASGEYGLTTGVAADSQPVWSPDGSRIAFARIDNTNAQYSEIWVINSDGSGTAQLTHLPCLNRDPSWSPDGKTIVFWSSSADCANGDYALFALDVSSGVAAPFNPPNTNSGSPAWSPDGTRIAFASDGDGGSGFEICVMDADGSNRHAITNLSGDDTDPAWSPDAEQIAFMRDGGIYTMSAIDPDSTPHLLVAHAIQPAWY